MIREAANTSIMGRAVKNGLICVQTINIRDYSANKHMRVDDYPYGGGAGMVIEAEPVFRAVNAAKEQAVPGTRVVYLTPQAKVLDQLKVEELAMEKELIILCGHYEGIDERVLEEVVTDNISIGDYVLTGGELGALVLMDAVSRFVPGVLSNEDSSRFESVKDSLLEYPHYTRPEIWHEKAVPEVLLCGDHARIEEWRYEKALERTKERRPDLLASYRKLHTVFFGPDEVRKTADTVGASVSLYGESLDYNRNKLRKGARDFREDDLVLFVTDAESLSEFPEVLARMTAEKTQAFVLICGGGTVPEEAGELLSAKGFVLREILPAGGEEPERIALKIRSSVL